MSYQGRRHGIGHEVYHFLYDGLSKYGNPGVFLRGQL